MSRGKNKFYERKRRTKEKEPTMPNSVNPRNEQELNKKNNTN